MITQSFPSLRPKPPVVVYPPYKYTPPLGPLGGPRKPTGWDVQKAEKFKITPEEFVRRDEIVRKMWRECNWREGDVLCPRGPQSRDKYGTNIKVEGIYRTYHDFHENEKWPSDDEPYIMTVRPERGANGGRICCTPDFLMRPGNGSSC